MEFINLNDEELEISKPKITFKKIVDDLMITDLPKIQLEAPKEEEELCVKDCDNSIYYGCPTDDGSFKVSNLFSELTTDYQRALARLALGIGDEFTNEWGNIKGNILHQEDLVKLLYEQLSFKADLKSPVFSGIPLSTRPSINDESNQIATTGWVMEKLKNFEGGSGSGSGTLSIFSLDPPFAFKGDGEIELNLSWAYRKDITSQKLNGEILDNSIRTYTTLVSEDTKFVLEFTAEGITETRSITFLYKYPKYFGTSIDINQLEKTDSNKFSINCKINEHAYIILPNNSEARFSVNGFVGGFKMIGTLNLFDLTYYIYQSTNQSLGKIVVELLD